MALLEVEGVSVSFGGVQALDDVDLAVPADVVTGLIGPNGAGKTTLFNVVCGLQHAQDGRVVLDGNDVTSLRPYRRARLGIARTFQRLELFGSLTVRDNVRVAADVYLSWHGSDNGSSAAVADEVLERTGLAHVAGERAEALPTGTSRVVELARALATRPRVLLLDEPSSGLDTDETAGLAALLRDLAGGGLAVLLVEHDVDLVMKVSAHIHVLDFGRILAVGTPKEIRASEAVQQAYLGGARA